MSQAHHEQDTWMQDTDPQESGLIKVSFAPTKDNLSDIGTKNVTGDVFDQIRPKSMSERPEDV